MSNPIKIAVAAGLALMIGAAATWLWCKEQTVYVDQAKLFGEFKLKKVLEAEFQKVEGMRRQQADSLELVVLMAGRQVSTREQAQYHLQMQQQLQAKKQEFAEMNDALKQEFNEQIWNQLNQYVKDLAEKNGYDFILGGTGDGTVMYAEPGRDVTAQAIEYVNKRFDGEKK